MLDWILNTPLQCSYNKALVGVSVEIKFQLDLPGSYLPRQPYFRGSYLRWDGAYSFVYSMIGCFSQRISTRKGYLINTFTVTNINMSNSFN